MKRWGLALAVAQFAHIAGWGVYYAVSRMLPRFDPRVDLLVLAWSETLPSALSIASSVYAARRGYRSLLAFGFLEGLGLAAFGLLEWPLVVVASLVASVAWAVAGPLLITAILEWGARGAKLGALLAANALGWSFGSFIGPVLVEAFGVHVAMTAAGAMVLVCYVLALAYAPPASIRGGGTRVSAAATLLYSIAYSPFVAATEATFTLVMGKLSRCLPPLVYALVLLATGVASAAGKVAVGRLVERVRPSLVYRAAYCTYATWMLVSSSLPCAALAVAYVMPLYPLMELGFYEHLTPLMGERRASAAWAASYTIASVILLALDALGLTFQETLITCSVLTVVALAATYGVERLVFRGAVGLSARARCSAEGRGHKIPGDELRARDATSVEDGFSR